MRRLVFVKLSGGLHEMKQLKRLPIEPGSEEECTDVSSYYLHNREPTSRVRKMILYWY